MELTGRTPSLKAPVLFNMNGLDKAGVARVEGAVKAARDTLALADRLQAVRDVNRAIWKGYDQLRRTTSLSRPIGVMMDFSL